MVNFFNETPKFLGWNNEDYIRENIRYTVPMTAKEIQDSETQLELLADPNYIVEEKFDGTRGTLHFYDGGNRCFSRRESKKSNWLTENSDSLPQLRDISVPGLEGTVLDGEMFIPGRPFKDVAAIMNCTYDKAIERQKELGWVVLHSFDILYYKNVCTEHMPLLRRKYYLEKVITEVNYFFKHEYNQAYPYIKSVPYGTQYFNIHLTDDEKEKLEYCANSYPALWESYCNSKKVTDLLVPCKAYYEYIVMRGGEGVMVKPIDGRYYHKRSREYQKIKKFLTRDVIICGFTKPTREYNGKFPTPQQWNYWEDDGGTLYNTQMNGDLVGVLNLLETNFENSCVPVTKYYYENWVGNIIFGVIITDEEIAKLPKNKKFDIITMGDNKVIIVGECSGFDEEQREYFSNNKKDMIGKVIEVKANEQFSDTGKLRHPRFLWIREDKSASQCTWKDHFG